MSISVLQVAVQVANGKIKRVRVRERNGEGKFVDLGHPWSAANLGDIQAVRRAVNMLGRGISDTDDIVRLANHRRLRGHRPKKPPASSSAQTPSL